MDFDLSDEKTWPLDNPDEISLARAVTKLGILRHGDDWQQILRLATEPFQKHLPSLDQATKLDRIRAWSLLPEYGVRKPAIVSDKYGERIHFSEKDWHRASQVILDRHAIKHDAANHIQAIKMQIRDACLTGKLTAYAQIHNGDTLPIRSALWKTARFARWFHTGRASAREVVDQPFMSDEPMLWVFFQWKEFEKAFWDTEEKREPSRYKESAVKAWCSNYWQRFDGETLHTFNDGKKRAYPRFREDFSPAMDQAFPDISTTIIRNAWDDRPVDNRRHRDKHKPHR